MKTFNATELNKEPAQVFRAADKDGAVSITHDRYPDVVFMIEARARDYDSDAFHKEFPNVDLGKLYDGLPEAVRNELFKDGRPE